MTARKSRQSEWLPIIKEIGVVLCVVISAVGSTVAMVIGAQNKATVVDVEKTVGQIQLQTDGTLTAAKLAVAISAESLAESTKKPEHQKVAQEARAAYEAQLMNQRNADIANSKRQ